MGFNDNEFISLGVRSVWGSEHHFGLTAADRSRHCYCIGKSGSGKTTLLKNMIVQDFQNGNGIAVLDPHGDLASELLDFIPRSRADDLVFFDPSDRKDVIGLDFFKGRKGPYTERITSGLVSSFKHAFSEFWGPRLEYILFASIASLLHCENTSLL